MRRTLPFLTLTLVLLAACGKGATETYNVTFVNVAADKMTSLGGAVERLAQSRVESMEGKPLAVTFKEKGNGGTLTVQVNDETLLSALTDQLVAPFTLALMREPAAGESTDITVGKDKKFHATGITQNDIDWVTASADISRQKGLVTITLLPESQPKLQKIFQAAKGKQMGLFVRDRLISNFIADGTPQTSITISNVPSLKVATLFADDVNVGVHAKFVPAR